MGLAVEATLNKAHREHDDGTHPRTLGRREHLAIDAADDDDGDGRGGNDRHVGEQEEQPENAEQDGADRAGVAE